MNFGTIQTPEGFAYDRHQNPLLAQNIVRVTVAPFGRAVVNYDVDNSEYATVEAAAAFARVLHAEMAEADEAATFTTSYPKYVLVAGARKVNAGAVASILGNDIAYGLNDGAKGGFLAAELGEEYDAAVHPALVRALKKAVGA